MHEKRTLVVVHEVVALVPELRPVGHHADTGATVRQAPLEHRRPHPQHVARAGGRVQLEHPESKGADGRRSLVRGHAGSEAGGDGEQVNRRGNQAPKHGRLGGDGVCVERLRVPPPADLEELCFGELVPRVVVPDPAFGEVLVVAHPPSSRVGPDPRVGPPSPPPAIVARCTGRWPMSSSASLAVRASDRPRPSPPMLQRGPMENVTAIGGGAERASDQGPAPPRRRLRAGADAAETLSTLLRRIARGRARPAGSRRS